VSAVLTLLAAPADRGSVEAPVHEGDLTCIRKDEDWALSRRARSPAW
jgi:hypothetical protein